MSRRAGNSRQKYPSKTEEVCPLFHANPLINPRTGKGIMYGKQTFQKLSEECGEPPQADSPVRVLPIVTNLTGDENTDRTILINLNPSELQDLHHNATLVLDLLNSQAMLKLLQYKYDLCTIDSFADFMLAIFDEESLRDPETRQECFKRYINAPSLDSERGQILLSLLEEVKNYPDLEDIFHQLLVDIGDLGNGPLLHEILETFPDVGGEIFATLGASMGGHRDLAFSLDKYSPDVYSFIVMGSWDNYPDLAAEAMQRAPTDYDWSTLLELINSSQDPDIIAVSIAALARENDRQDLLQQLLESRL
jgi:hypothetical protein